MILFIAQSTLKRESGYFYDGIQIPSYSAAFNHIKICFPEIVFIVLGANQDSSMLSITLSKEKG